MSDATPEPTEGSLPIVADAANVAQAKSAWRKHAASLSWEEKVAAIERMRERDAILRREREALRVAQKIGRASCRERV